MANILSLFAAPFNKIIDSVGDAIDKNVTNDEERQTLNNALTQIKATSELELQKIELEYEKELTKRHQNDMASDSWLSKNIRPGAFIFMLLVTMVFTLTDGNIIVDDYTFTVKQGWVDLWTTLTITFAAFYAGGRSIEKWRKIKNDEKVT